MKFRPIKLFGIVLCAYGPEMARALLGSKIRGIRAVPFSSTDESRQ